MKKMIKKNKIYSLKLTKFELLHLRDLFSISLPPDMKVTLSQQLAQTQNRVLVESKLWQKVVTSCTEAKLPLDSRAPDFVVALSTIPAISVFELSSEPFAESSEEEEQVNPIIPED